MSNRAGSPRITPEMLLRAYAIGIFPMAESRHDPHLYWIDPDARGILPLDDFHVPRSLKKTVLKGPFQVTADRAFEDVVARLRGAGARAPADLDQRHDLRPVPQAARHGLRPLGGDLAGRRAGRRPLWRRARRRVLRREHVQPRDRRQQGRAGASGGAPEARRLRAARYPVRDQASRALRRGRDLARPLSQAPHRGAEASRVVPGRAADDGALRRTQRGRTSRL